MQSRYSRLSGQSEERKGSRDSKSVRQSALLLHLQSQNLKYFNHEPLRQSVKKLQPFVRRLQHLQNLRKKKAYIYNPNHAQYLKDCLKHISEKFFYYRDIKSGVFKEDLYLAIMLNYIQRAIEQGDNSIHDLLHILNSSVARSKFILGVAKSTLLGYMKQLYYRVLDFSQLEGLTLFYQMLLYSQNFPRILPQVVKSMVVHFYKKLEVRSLVKNYPNEMSQTDY